MKDKPNITGSIFVNNVLEDLGGEMRVYCGLGQPVNHSTPEKAKAYLSGKPVFEVIIKRVG